MESSAPTIIQLVRMGMDEIGGTVSPATLCNWVMERRPTTTVNTVKTHINSATVNSVSRRHYPENNRPRQSDTDHRYDILFRPADGLVERYDPLQHGVWELALDDNDEMIVRRVGDNGGLGLDDREPPDMSHAFAAEAHLRDYLAQHLNEIEPGLTLFTDEGRTGVEFVIPVGRIDLLAVDSTERYVVIELKVGRGSHAVVGQTLLYKNWVQKHMAEGQPVRGIIIAQNITDKIRYAIASDASLSAMQYELSMTLHPVAGV